VPTEVAGAGKEGFAVGFWAVQGVEQAWIPSLPASKPVSHDALTSSSTLERHASPNLLYTKNMDIATEVRVMNATSRNQLPG
jgi:hypothetical protein